MVGRGDFVTNVPHGATTTAFFPGPKGENAEYTVVHGGYAEQTSPNTRCPDWFVADVHVGIIRVR
jgi:hypothetical protein